MINRHSLAVAIPILLATSTVSALDIFNKHGNKLEVYGRINPNHEFSNSSLSTSIESKDDHSNAVLGLSGFLKITNKLSSYAKLEYNTHLFLPENSEHQKTNAIRLGYAGFKYGNWGSIDYGRNYGVMHEVEELTNHTSYTNKSKIFVNNDNYMIGRNNSLLTYRNNSFFGLSDNLSFVLQYQDSNTHRSSDAKKGSGWGASVKYKTNLGFTAIGSCFSSKQPKLLQNNEVKLKNADVHAYGLGFKYDANDIYIAAFYGSGYNLNDIDYVDNSQNSNVEKNFNQTQSIEAIAEYDFHSGFHPSLSYSDSTLENFNTQDKSLSSNKQLTKEISINTRYEFNKNISTYVNYRINLLKNDVDQSEKKPTDNIIGAGVVYQF
ncbi:porin [Buchnera aphidicola (Muscaphis stroyani)]|uniref:Porin n=1 Tax=Buchnera aphidicola (Muscaphis stroyani) TaxID=1241869 RepID=A0A4D6YF13_9GAMM|nr:porin [Buchnera aphidicola]QCI24424.1 porin [Buchnera aphidicola (Muscaphis stroyani)]